jgi:hypothetical protein
LTQESRAGILTLAYSRVKSRDISNSILGPPGDVERWGVTKKSGKRTKIKKAKCKKIKSERRRTI